MYPTCRPASQHSKMFRFLNAYSSNIYKFVVCRYPKIGTFSGIGRRCGGGIFKGGAFARSAPLNWLLLVLFLPVKKRTYSRHIVYKKVYFYDIQNTRMAEPSGICCILGNYLKYLTAALNIWMS